MYALAYTPKGRASARPFEPYTRGTMHMTTIEIARRMAQLGETKEALRAYEIVTTEDSEPAELLEAAAYILDNGGDYQVSYTTFVQLFNAGHFREQILQLMTRVFYEPNIKLLKGRYERNVKLLKKYPYLFRKDFVPFDELPLVFFPYDDHSGYVPYDTTANEFLGFVNVKDTIISRNFFKDLEKPILASDVYSQYELEYLYDNVRPSEWVGRENHIYLHYTDWAAFCSWLTVLNMKPLLREFDKFVFLIEDELAQYPIDFKERYGKDYDKLSVKPVGIREINKLIWHTQLSSHNGGDFFNEVFDGHPNLLCLPSMMYSEVEKLLDDVMDGHRTAKSLAEFAQHFPTYPDQGKISELYAMRNPTKKDLLVFRFFGEPDFTKTLDAASRIAPAVFFQPHFSNVIYELRVDEMTGKTALYSPEAEQIENSPILASFKYVKTFTPLRRFTTSYGGTLRFMLKDLEKNPRGLEAEKTVAGSVIPDVISERILNRSYLRDPESRLYRDSIVVRFEDGKLNPKATFTRLAEFLDIPYTQSMTYCSQGGDIDPQQFDTNAVGFDPVPVYNNYDDLMNDAERYFIEFCLRDAYNFYSYDFQQYDGAALDEQQTNLLVDRFATLNGLMRDAFGCAFGVITGLEEEAQDILRDGLVEDMMRKYDANRRNTVRLLLKDLRFINRRGQPLEFTPMLEPDPDLLDQPLYH